MKISEEFKFLNLNAIKRKNAEELDPKDQFFYTINFLDVDNNPVKFFSFDNALNNTLIKAINEQKLKGLQDCLVHIELAYVNNGWVVRLLGVEFE